MPDRFIVRQYIVPDRIERRTKRIPNRPPTHCVYLAARIEDAVWGAQLAAPAGIRIHRAATLDELAMLMDVVEARIVLADFQHPEENWKDVLRLLEERYPGSVLIVAAAPRDATVWEQVVLAGGFDVVLKPFTRAELLLVLGQAQRYLPLIAPAAVQARHIALMNAIRRAAAQGRTPGSGRTE
jgi:response regulator of citrate/malate metabolism